jgi:TATA-binding protein-associated factor Taf7
VQIGNYVWRKRDDQDAWLDELDTMDPKVRPALPPTGQHCACCDPLPIATSGLQQREALQRDAAKREGYRRDAQRDGAEEAAKGARAAAGEASDDEDDDDDNEDSEAEPADAPTARLRHLRTVVELLQAWAHPALTAVSLSCS